jgi:hypothetical protein
LEKQLRAYNAVEAGLKGCSKGENNPDATLTEKQVIEIFNDSRPSRELGSVYGVSKTTILSIKNGKTWQHLGLTSMEGSQ